MDSMTGLSSILQRLEFQGSVTLPGRPSEALSRWRRKRSIAIGISFAAAGAGVVLIIIGAIVRDVGFWSLSIIVGALLGVLGLFVGVILVGVGLLWRERIASEKLPVRLDAVGISLRGIGHIPWRDLRAPERRYVPVKNDIGGRCTVMPLTQRAQARVRMQPGDWQLRVGPRPYLSFDQPFLLLPGVQGLSEDEVVRLFHHVWSTFSTGYQR
ncbi:MAG: hypothetical protein ACTMKZ_01225 [Brevibacterium aurantiacum]|nr:MULTISPECIES: hypothetical protein [Brevibacterium]MDN5551179.1 hypothetical protein [Brevibacterium sp.]MDN5594999.1 hypothetical protein [Brevibacterium sp.]MDN5712106.1 hypothetical protein [Brevibacterium aurantiacum]MDN5736699.1 hypothetical protein [Brevibacterium aurantiacum]MDN5737523.1 hypothetical protein [Brevibacterium aurantiacum]